MVSFIECDFFPLWEYVECVHVHFCVGAHACVCMYSEAREPCLVSSTYILRCVSHLNPEFADWTNLMSQFALGIPSLTLPLAPGLQAGDHMQSLGFV